MHKDITYLLLSLSSLSEVDKTLDGICNETEAAHIYTTSYRDILENLLDHAVDLILFHTAVSEETIIKTLEIIANDEHLKYIPIVVISDLKDNEQFSEKLSDYPVISIFTYKNWKFQVKSLLRFLQYAKAHAKDLHENLITTNESNFIDPLTGALNRRGGEKKFESSVGYYASNEEPFSLIILDIDFFKKVNDTYGHNVGDEVLVAISSIINEAISKDDVLVRFGGEEFMVFLSNCTIGTANEKAEILRQKIESASYSTHKFGVTASFGVVEYKSGVTLENLVEKADALLYKAKADGRNRVYSELKI